MQQVAIVQFENYNLKSFADTASVTIDNIQQQATLNLFLQSSKGNSRL